MVLLTSRSNSLIRKWKTGKIMWIVTSSNINLLLNSTSRNHRILRDNFPVAATTYGCTTTTTNNVSNWSISRERTRSNMIISGKGGHPILLRAAFRQPPQGYHSVNAWYKMKQSKKSIVTQIIVITIPLSLTLILYPLMYFFVPCFHPFRPIINIK